MYLYLHAHTILASQSVSGSEMSMDSGQPDLFLFYMLSVLSQLKGLTVSIHLPPCPSSPPSFLFVCFSRQGFSVYPSCPGTHSVDQAGLELKNPLASASQVLALKACATTTRLSSVL